MATVTSSHDTCAEDMDLRRLSPGTSGCGHERKQIGLIAHRLNLLFTPGSGGTGVGYVDEELKLKSFCLYVCTYISVFDITEFYCRLHNALCK
jgi:hypothetical protein